MSTRSNRPPRRNSFATADTGRRSRHRPDGGSRPACKSHGLYHIGSARNVKQGPANSENRQQIGVAPVHPCTCALKRYELLPAARRYAEDLTEGPKDASRRRERTPVMLG